MQGVEGFPRVEGTCQKSGTLVSPGKIIMSYIKCHP